MHAFIILFNSVNQHVSSVNYAYNHVHIVHNISEIILIDLSLVKLNYLSWLINIKDILL